MLYLEISHIKIVYSSYFLNKCKIAISIFWTKIKILSTF